MTNPPKAPREFKLIVEDWRTNALSWNVDTRNDLTTGEEIHVIEYEPVLALIDRLEKTIENAIPDIECGEGRDCLHSMRESLKIIKAFKERG